MLTFPLPPVPESATGGLLLAGLSVLAAVRGRRGGMGRGFGMARARAANQGWWHPASLSRTFGTLALATSSCAANAAIVVTVPGTADPWLAGMPPGSTASSFDSAPAQSPVLVPGTVVPGTEISLLAAGLVANSPNIIHPCCPLVGPDGGYFISRERGSENGIASVRAPINSLVGVFLGETPASSAPAPLDFAMLGTSQASFSPLLGQAFFIGDGVTGTTDGSVQNFIVPLGATRLFLGTMDGDQWTNNIGSFTVTVAGISAVPEPVTWLMLLSGLPLLAKRQRLSAFSLTRFV